MALLKHRVTRPRPGFAAAFGWLMALLAPLVVSGQVSRDYDVKAVFLFNFAQFVEWPQEAFHSAESPFVIGILGADPFRGVIDQVVQNERVRTRPVRVERYQQVDQAKDCQILFIGSSEWRRIPDILTSLQGRPILTVSEADGFARQGGMIRFYTEKSKVRLAINNDAARAVQLSISAKLLRVADVVSAEPRR